MYIYGVFFVKSTFALYIGGIFLSLVKNIFLFPNRERPNLFIQRPSLNIMDVLRHKRLCCYDVYDKYFPKRDEIGGFWAKNGQNLDFPANLA